MLCMCSWMLDNNIGLSFNFSCGLFIFNFHTSYWIFLLRFCKLIFRYGSMAGKGFYKDIIEGDTYKYYANGEWKVSSSGKFVPITNPFTLQVQFKVQCKCYCLPPTSISSHDIQELLRLELYFLREVFVLFQSWSVLQWQDGFLWIFVQYWVTQYCNFIRERVCPPPEVS